MSKQNEFVELNRKLTKEVVAKLVSAGQNSAVIVEAPPGAGKSTLTASVAERLVSEHEERIAIVTQTNEQADDLVRALVSKYPKLSVGRMVGKDPSPEIVALEDKVEIAKNTDDLSEVDVILSTARKWQYERSRLQESSAIDPFRFALIDEAYQMRSDMLLGVAEMFKTLLCVGDPGQLDPFTVIDDSLWKGLTYSPSRSALATLRAFHEDIEPLRMPKSWRLPKSAAGIVSTAFYPFGGFEAGTKPEHRSLEIKRKPKDVVDEILEHAAGTGWAYNELPEKYTLRTDREIAVRLATLVERLLKGQVAVVDERDPKGRRLEGNRVAVIAAHNDQVHAVRYELANLGVALDGPKSPIVSTANKIQGREYDISLVWHPLSGRRDATRFHLEAGRMCVMLSRHRQACIVVGRAGARKLLEEFPDSDPVFLGEPEKFPDGWQANHLVLEHLERFRVG